MKQRARYARPTLSPMMFATVAALVAAAGCSSAPAGGPALIPESTVGTASVQGVGREILAHDKTAETETVAAATNLVWGVLGGVYEQIGIPVTATDSRSMSIGNLGYEARRIDGSRMNTYLDCGTNFNGPLANHYAVTLSVVTRLNRADSRSTEISTVVDASAKPRTNAGYPVQCTTRETLEALIVGKVKEALELGS